MKFIHVADIHLDMPFKALGYLGEKRRLEQIENLKKLIDLIKLESIEYLFIAGDLYEHEYIKDYTMNMLIELFKEIPNVHIFISPGNHDPYVKESMYEKYSRLFPVNVHVFKSFECIETEKANIYGYGFTDFYDEGIDFTNFKIKENGKRNILVVHGDLEGSKNDEIQKKYNPLDKKELEKIGFDYVALGHIHKSNYNPMETIVYPGSFMNYRFQDDNAGFIKGEFKKGIVYQLTNNHRTDGFRHMEEEKLYIEHITFDDRIYEEINVDITEIRSIQELITHIMIKKLNKMNYIKINLIGEKNFEINTRYIFDNLDMENIIKINDLTTINYDLEEISKENTLRGVFVKNALKEIEILSDSEEDIKKKQNIQKAIEIMMEEMRNS